MKVATPSQSNLQRLPLRNSIHSIDLLSQTGKRKNLVYTWNYKDHDQKNIPKILHLFIGYGGAQINYIG